MNLKVIAVKKFFFLLMVLSFSFAEAQVLVSSDYGNLFEVDSTVINPSPLYPGDEVTLNIIMKNRGSNTVAENVSAVLGLSNNFVSVINSDSVDFVGPLDTQTFVFKFKLKDIEPGTYKLPLNLSYERFTGGTSLGSESKEYQVLLNVSGYRSLDITNTRVVASGEAPHVGENILVLADVKNNGSLESRNVVVRLVPETGASFGDIVPLSETSLKVSNIAPGEQIDVEFSLYLSDALLPGVYNYKLTASDLDSNSVDSENVSIEVKGSPQLILSGVDFSIEGRDDKKLFQGDSFSLSIQVDNIGEEKAQAVEVILSMDEALTGINESFIGTIDPDDSGSAIFDLTILPSIAVGDSPVKISINYLDEFKNKQTFNKEINLFVHARPVSFPFFEVILLIILLVAAYFVLKQGRRLIDLYEKIKKRKH